MITVACGCTAECGVSRMVRNLPEEPIAYPTFRTHETPIGHYFEVKAAMQPTFRTPKTPFKHYFDVKSVT